MSGRGRRWPGWVYSAGGEPDYRYSLANERTFLAWVRTALGLLAGAVAVDTLAPDDADAVATILAVTLVVLALAAAAAAWVRWARTERAMRLGDPLPTSGSTAWLAAAVVVLALLVVVLVLR